MVASREGLITSALLPARAERVGAMSACFSSCSSVSNNQHHELMLKAFSVVEPVNGDWLGPIRRVAQQMCHNQMVSYLEQADRDRAQQARTRRNPLKMIEGGSQ